MIPIVLGQDQDSKRNVVLNRQQLTTHLHLIGGTGTGKTTAIRTITYPLLMDSQEPCAFFLVDPMGNLSNDLLTWMANEQECPQHVRDRLIYIEPARGDVVVPFNPLRHQGPEQLYFQVARAVEVVLRAWASQNVEEMPRLRYWMFNAFFAIAEMGMPLAMAEYLLRPGSEEHKALLRALPETLRNMWGEILTARGSEAIRLLESTRNRLAPFFDSGILRRMFSSNSNYFDVAQFIRDRRIVIVNVASRGVLEPKIGHTIGGFIVNELIQSALNMDPKLVRPTYLLLDEFQHFVGPDLYDALPLVRQAGLRFILSHQSFSQLIRGETDLTGIIWQARSRLVFANDAEDADIVAREFASMSFDSYRLKERLTTQRQIIIGHRREWLNSVSHAESRSTGINESSSKSSTISEGESMPPQALLPTESSGIGRAEAKGQSESWSNAASDTRGQSEALVPIHKNFEEVSSNTYFTFDEQDRTWAQRIRTLKTGYCIAKLRDDEDLHYIKIRHFPVSESEEVAARKEELLQRNFQSACFVPATRIEEDAERLRIGLLRPLIQPGQLNSDDPLAIPPQSEIGESPTNDEQDFFR